MAKGYSNEGFEAPCPCGYIINTVEPVVGDTELRHYYVHEDDKQSKVFWENDDSRKNPQVTWLQVTIGTPGRALRRNGVTEDPRHAELMNLRLGSWLYYPCTLKVQGKSQRTKGVNEPIPHGTNQGSALPSTKTKNCWTWPKEFRVLYRFIL